MPRSTDDTTMLTDPVSPRRAPTLEPKLVLCRNDQGDGGWSLHAPGASDDDIAEGLAPPLLTGAARMIAGAWSRPNRKDYRLARSILATR